VAGSSNPKFFRGKGGDADADEFAFHADQRGLFKAMHATAMVWGHQLRLWGASKGRAWVWGHRVGWGSTQKGEGSFFNRMCAAALRQENPEASSQKPVGNATGIEHFRVSILDAVEQGIVDRIKGISAPDPVARREWL